MAFYRFSYVIVSSLLVGCANQAVLPEPQVNLPQQWQYQSVSTHQTQDLSPWWLAFNDPQLNDWINLALTRNNDLTLASLKVRQAQLQAGLVDEQQGVNLSSSLSANQSKSLKEGSHNHSYQAKVSASYEVDLWQKLAHAQDAATWTAMATEQERESTAQALVATTAQLYWQIGYLNQRIALLQQDIQTAQRNLDIVQSQYQHGATNRLAILESQRTLSSLENSLSSQQQSRDETINAFTLLFDQGAPSLANADWLLPNYTLPEVQAGVPSELLSRRPDVKHAFYQLSAYFAQQQETQTNYLPSLSLTGALGSSSTSLRKLLSDPVASLGVDLNLPFLNWQEKKLERELAQVAYESAVVTYRQTLYSAFQDVDNALSLRRSLNEQHNQLMQQHQQRQEETQIYQSQYRYGAADLISLLSAQDKERAAQATVLENRYQQLANLATLYQSLGGAISPLTPNQIPQT